MTTAIDDTLSKFIEKLRQEEAAGLASGLAPGRKDATVEEPRVAPQRPEQQRITLYSRVATVLIVLLLIATGVSYFLYRTERDAITARIDSIVRTPLANPLEQRFLELEQKFADTRSANETRLQTVEQQLVSDRQASEQALQDMEQRLAQMNAPQERRLQRVEQRLASLQQPGGKRLQAIESRLEQLTARMDDWAAVVAGLSNNDQPVTTMKVATAPEPPAADSIEPVITGRDNVVLQTQPQSVPKASFGKPPVPDSSAAHGPQGNWVINIGSYLREKTAARKLAEFRKQGVSAELVSARVRGKTIYRIQVAGFDSMAEASQHAGRVRQVLGLDETWIRRK